MSGGEQREGADDVMAALLALPPQEFTEARNEAVKRLRGEGRRDAADAVKRLTRPSLSLWALNRLAQEDPSPIEAFLDAAARLLEAHRRGGDIRAATPPEREAEARVVSAASEIVLAQGAKMTDAVTSRLRETLRAAAADAEVAAALRTGRLTHEPEAPSLEEILASLPSGPAARKKQKASPADALKDQRRALRTERDGARKEASEAHAAARAAAATAEEARREWQRAQAAAERKQRQAEAAEERVRALEGQLDAL
jgi:chromosome segregation ATPase